MEITINKYKWKVAFVPGDSESMVIDEECYRSGLTEYVEQKISIRQGMSRERTRATVIHELIHAFIDSYGYNGDCMTEEELCDFFGAVGDEVMKLADEIMEGVDFDADRTGNCKSD